MSECLLAGSSAFAHSGTAINASLQPGEHDIQNLFAQLTNGDALFRKATDLVMKPFADGLDEAQKQIRDTKNMFGIQSADGLLILLNDIVEMAGPPLIYKRLEEYSKDCS